MSKSTISTYEFFKMFPDDDSANDWFAARRWGKTAHCLHCGAADKVYRMKGGGRYRCGHCKKDSNIKAGTLMTDSPIPIRKWLFAIYLLMTARKGVSSLQLAKEIGITQKSAWFLLHRLREACGDDPELLTGVIEVDETYIGGLERNKHGNKKTRAGRGAVGKAAVMGMRQRGGKTKAAHIKRTDRATMQGMIGRNVAPGAQVYTDDHRSYIGLAKTYGHEAVKHSVGEYVKGMAHTNGIESVWAVLKRGYNGTYHHFSAKHLQRYVDEFAFRLNEGNVKRHTMERLDSLSRLLVGKNITYKKLIK